MSWFGVQVVKVKLENHPNADKLSLVKLTTPFECTVVVNTEEWKDGQQFGRKILKLHGNGFNTRKESTK